MEERKIQESPYLRKSQRTTLSNNLLKKISKSMDEKRNINIKELYAVAFNANDKEIFKILSNEDFENIIYNIDKETSLRLEKIQIAKILSPYAYSDLIKEMKKDFNQKHLDFIIKEIYIRIFGINSTKGNKIELIKDYIHKI